MIAFLARLLINAAALLLIAWLYDGVKVDGWFAAIVAAFILGILNAVIRPLLIILTLPVTILTLGLFIFVINALLFWLVSAAVDGFQVGGFWAAMLGSILFSVITLITSSLLYKGK
jgi:putative membrane protein